MSSPIQAGASIPAIPVKELAADGPEPFVLKGKNIIVGVPGAFTGTCSAQVPGYINALKKFQEKGVNGIYVVAINDVFVTKAWKSLLAPEGTEVRFIADDKGEFSEALGLTFDATAVLGTHRSHRYAIVAEDNKVVSIDVEPVPGNLTITAAEKILAKL
ncbi:Redoxin [Tricholoma matsutake]|nr:Redoxin [Tricholoma matsutake 945]